MTKSNVSAKTLLKLKEIFEKLGWDTKEDPAFNRFSMTLEFLDSETRLSSADFHLNYDYLQNGYGVVGDYDRNGVRTLANHGIISGPVYSGRAFGALLDLMAKGSIPCDGKTLFWHTGGAGELDFYKHDLF